MPIWHGVQLTPISIKQFQELAKNDEENENQSVFLPNSERGITLSIPDTNTLVREGKSINFCLRIEYEYANQQKGNYELLGHYDPRTGANAVDYENVE